MTKEDYKNHRLSGGIIFILWDWYCEKCSNPITFDNFSMGMSHYIKFMDVDVILSHYNNKFNIVEVFNKNGDLIRIV